MCGLSIGSLGCIILEKLTQSHKLAIVNTTVSAGKALSILSSQTRQKLEAPSPGNHLLMDEKTSTKKYIYRNNNTEENIKLEVYLS